MPFRYNLEKNCLLAVR